MPVLALAEDHHQRDRAAEVRVLAVPKPRMVGFGGQEGQEGQGRLLMGRLEATVWSMRSCPPNRYLLTRSFRTLRPTPMVSPSEIRLTPT